MIMGSFGAPSLPLLVEAAKNRRRGLFDVIPRRRPVDDGDSHRSSTVPGRPARPARAFALHTTNHRIGERVGALFVFRAEPNQDLIENDVVQDLDSRLSAQPRGEKTRGPNSWGRSRFPPLPPGRKLGLTWPEDGESDPEPWQCRYRRDS